MAYIYIYIVGISKIGVDYAIKMLSNKLEKSSKIYNV
jgi:hypothetical protein